MSKNTLAQVPSNAIVQEPSAKPTRGQRIAFAKLMKNKQAVRRKSGAFEEFPCYSRSAYSPQVVGKKHAKKLAKRKGLVHV